MMFLLGLNLKFGYFCMMNFFIYTCTKLHNVDFEFFIIIQLPMGFILRFCHSVSKNSCIDVTKCCTNKH